MTRPIGELENGFLNSSSDMLVPFWSQLSQNLTQQGYSIHQDIFNDLLLKELLGQIKSSGDDDFQPAGIGRGENFSLDTSVRRDEIRWIIGRNEIEKTWLGLMKTLRLTLNRHLFLGLEYFESHFAYYGPNSFYKKHKDAFVGQDNRILSVILYLNEDWKDGDGGELKIYEDHDVNIPIEINDKNQPKTLAIIKPTFGTLVIFLSEEFPHEVLPTHKKRYSIAGWFRSKQPDALPGIQIL